MKPLLQRSLITLALLGANQALAGGLWITEYGQPTQGRAGAGEEAGNGDATDAFLEPRVHEQTEAVRNPGFSRCNRASTSNSMWSEAASPTATGTAGMPPIRRQVAVSFMLTH